MKKIAFTIFAALSLLTLSAQEKPAQQPKDTTIVVTLNINQFRALLAAIDLNIDSKKTSKEILEFLQSNAKLLAPPAEPADKPKVSTTPKKN